MPPAESLVERLVAFGRVLRDEGLEVGPGRVADALAALDAAGVGDRERVYWTLRQTLVSARDEIEPFDRAFAAWLLGRRDPPQPRESEALRPKTVELAAAGWSPDELLRQKDFAELTPEELARLRVLIAGLALTRPLRRSRRLRSDPRGTTLDLRRMVRAALAAGGDPARPAFRRRADVRRKVVVLCDVSGSMEPYARALLLFVHSLLRSGRGVEAFAFGTRLTRVTTDLSRRDPDAALHAVSDRVADWSGGTRIGAALHAFNDTWGRHGVSHGAVVVIVSDGWEREDAGAVARETARLRRHAYALIWMNPLKGHPDYQPLAGGMRAALPHVDRFLPGHDFESLETLADVLARLGSRHAA